MASMWRASQLHGLPRRPASRTLDRQIAVTHVTRRSCAHEAPAEGLAVQEKDEDAEDDGSVLSSLLDEMRPYVLRRVKAHVEKSVPPKEEIVVSVALAPLQKRYYRALYEKNVLMLAGTGRPVPANMRTFFS